MHEVGLITELINTAKQIASEQQDNAVINKITISLGAFSCASVDSLQFAFEAMRADTVAHNARLEIKTIRTICKCNSCNAQNETDEIFGACPDCGSTEIELDGDSDLILTAIEIDD